MTILVESDQFQRPFSQINTVNIIGQAVEPLINIGADQGKDFIEIKQKTQGFVQ